MSGQRINSQHQNLNEMQAAFQRAKTITTCDRVVKGNQMTETCKNADGQAVKISVFLDRSGDGKFDSSEVISVRYNNVASRNGDWVEYRDKDNNGYCDEIATGDWMGGEHVEKAQPDQFHGNDGNRMDLKYGFKWDSNSPAYLK